MSEQRSKRIELLEATVGFCNAFASGTDPQKIIEQYLSKKITIIEHGSAKVAPFLGRTFEGYDGFREYVDNVMSYLQLDSMSFDDYIIDVTYAKVAVVGHAHFTAKETGQSWQEVLAYRLLFDEDTKLTRYEIWADSGSLHLARQGKLASK